MVAVRKSVEETKVALHGVVREMYDRIIKGDPPTMTLPVRTKNNIGFDPKLGVYKYGKKQLGCGHGNLRLYSQAFKQ